LKSSDLHVAGSKTSLLVNLCKEVGASEYISGSGGMNYLSRDMFLAEGIDLKVRDFSRHTLDLLEHRGVSIIHHIATLGPSVIKHFDMSNSTESLL
jgi:hypothetical protein